MEELPWQARDFLESYRQGKPATFMNGMVVHNTATGRRAWLLFFTSKTLFACVIFFLWIFNISIFSPYYEYTMALWIWCGWKKWVILWTSLDHQEKRPVTELRVALDRSEAGLIHQLVKGSVEGISRRGETSSTWVQLGLVVGFSGYNMVELYNSGILTSISRDMTPWPDLQGPATLVK